MTGLIIILSIIILFVVIIQISKINDITNAIRGEEATEVRNANSNGMYFLIFGTIFLVACVVSAIYYSDYLLGFGPNQSASVHGHRVDNAFKITLFFTSIVFFLTHIALFWFAYKYRYKPGKKALFLPHDNKLEVIWTAVPALVMTILVVQGLVTWNKVMADISEGEDHLEIEATGWQFAWNLRYPGADGKLGVKDFRLIRPGENELGQDWHDDRNHDDFNADELVLPKGKKIRVRITARDVLHNFYLPHFRVKMDAVPGIPTYFILTPEKTTEEYRQELRKYPEWNLPSDPNDPKSDPKWKTFNFELACAELCGKGHYSMRRLVKVVTPEEFDQWNKSQKSFYLSNIRNTDADPYVGLPVKAEVSSKAEALKTSLTKAMEMGSTEEMRTISLDNIYFESGSSKLSPESESALSILKEAFDKNPKLKVDISGHSDNTGDHNANVSLSMDRANAVKEYLTSHGIDATRMSSSGVGPDKPIASNDTPAGRAKNRRIEFKILSF